MSIKDNTKILDHLKQGVKRTISWDKYRSEITMQSKKKKKKKKNNLDEMIDPILRNINRLFVLSTKKVAIDPPKDTFDKYYMPLPNRTF